MIELHSNNETQTL